MAPRGSGSAQVFAIGWWLTTAFLASAGAQVPELVLEINSGNGPGVATPHYHAGLGEILYFAGSPAGEPSRL